MRSQVASSSTRSRMAAAAFPPQLQGEGKVIVHGHGPEQGPVLGHVADAAVAGGQIGHVALVQEDAPARDGSKASNRLQERGLPATRLAHQHAVTTGRHFERDAVEAEGPLADRHVGEADHGGPSDRSAAHADGSHEQQDYQGHHDHQERHDDGGLHPADTHLQPDRR